MAINERDKVPIFMIFPQVWQRNMKKQKSVALISYLMSLPFVTWAYYFFFIIWMLSSTPRLHFLSSEFAAFPTSNFEHKSLKEVSLFLSLLSLLSFLLYLKFYHCGLSHHFSLGLFQYPSNSFHFYQFPLRSISTQLPE